MLDGCDGTQKFAAEMIAEFVVTQHGADGRRRGRGRAAIQALGSGIQ